MGLLVNHQINLTVFRLESHCTIRLSATCGADSMFSHGRSHIEEVIA